MKKLLTILAFLALVISVSAQDAVINQAGHAGYFLTTQARKTAAYNYVVGLNNYQAAYLYTYQIKLIDNTGSNTASVVLAGSLDNVYYKTITTIPYTGNGADTTIIGNITSSPLSYRYLKFTITPSDTIWVKSLFINVLPTK